MTELFSQGKTLPEVYHNALWQLYYHGDVVECTDYKTKCLEASATLVIDDPLREPMISKYIPCYHRELQQYLMEMLDGILDWAVIAGKEPYTYHSRMTYYPFYKRGHEWTHGNQIDFILQELRRNPNSRRAVIDVRSNYFDMETNDPACLQHIQYFIRNGRLNCKVLFRSNDACKATFMNAFALIMLQKRIADELGVPVGQYVHRANSFHAYERDWESLNSFIKRFSKKPATLVDKYEGKDGWKEEMKAYVPDILRDMERLKAQCEKNTKF